ncbi:hypothetical protein [Rubritalea tangerina]|uniref:hypothetical protein n=1 Tax=Rubritalea tangerina TaxID=430798 RepID=UPI003623D1C2
MLSTVTSGMIRIILNKITKHGRSTILASSPMLYTVLFETKLINSSKLSTRTAFSITPITCMDRLSSDL